MPKHKNEFSFPPPGWPSNTVPSSRKSHLPLQSQPVPQNPLIPIISHNGEPYPNFQNPYMMIRPPGIPPQSLQYSHHHPSQQPYYIPPTHIHPHQPPLGVQYHQHSHHSIPSPQTPLHHHHRHQQQPPIPFPAPPPAGYYHIVPVPMNHDLNSKPNKNNQPIPTTAYQPVPTPNYRSSTYSHSSTPTRSSNTNSTIMHHSTAQPRSANGTFSSAASRQQQYQPPQQSQQQQQQYHQQVQQSTAYHHPQSFSPGVLPYFTAPPGQRTTDPSLNTPPTSQALYTTYPSRIRTGISSLVQPENITGGSKEREAFIAEQERELAQIQKGGGGGGSGTSTPRYDSPIPNKRPGLTSNFSSSRRNGGTGRGRVNYAENASDDDDEDDDEDEEDSELSDLEEPDSDPDDDNYGSRRRPGTERTARQSSRRDNSLIVGGYEHQLAMKAGKAKRKREEMDKGWTWLGDRTPAERVRSLHAKVTRHAYVSEELLEKEADRPELLVPISIDLDIPNTDPNGQGIRIKDRFLWNINEPFIDPLQFAQTFCDDLAIPITHAATISELIKNQLEENQNAVEIDISNEEVNEDDVIWSDEEFEEVESQMDLDGSSSPVTPAINGDSTQAISEKANVETEVPEDKEVEEEQDEEEEKEKEKVWEEADCRIIVNLDVQIYTHILRDRIEWDLSSTLPPSEFAKQYCSELGLSGEAIPLITWSIHEELLKHKKDALELDLFNLTHPEEQIKFEKLNIQPKTNLSNHSHRRSNHYFTSVNGKGKGLNGIWRDWFERDEYQPVLIELSTDEIIQREQERLRESRRIMRTLNTGNKRRR
ncbi:uncharacterized protein L201_003011 [Kwoniella dendrophila CBS 6074]|uniref:Chromatin structure-remodeling complex subunit SFH1 n=1 Tax=Kwoniella dendrophila CBS 6074 TaxID=1295534 RepID=A0AAX4JU78_9TREE